VRRAALAGIVKCDAAHAPDVLAGVAGNKRLPPGLRAYATSLLGQLPGQGPRLAQILEDARRETFASEDAIDVAAAAAHALGVLKDPSGARALLDAAEDPTFPVLQAAAVAALGEVCPPEAHAVFEKAAQLDDALVTRAARLAIEKCR
jgi:HEAT repeat protein